MRIPCLPIMQGKGDSKFWLCRVKVKDLLGKCRVDRQSPETPNGYQREVVRNRAKKFGKYMQEGNTSPVNFLINVRDKGISEEPGFLIIPDHFDWWIIDGQHRFEGLKAVIEDEEDDSLRELELPVALMNVDNVNEAKQFLIINKLHKGVRTDLAERILYILQQKEGKEATLNLPIEHWKSEALKIVDILTDRPESPLYRLIKRPGEKGIKPLKQVSVTDSLKPVIDAYKGYLKDEELVAKALMNMWGAMKHICPQCFSSAKDYLLLKTMGVFVMHRLFAGLLPTLWAEKDLTLGRFAKIFSHSAVSDYFSANYWEANNLDGISKYGTSQKSVSIVSDLIWDSMSNVLEELVPHRFDVNV